MTDEQLLNYIRGEYATADAGAIHEWVSESAENKARYRLIRNAWDLVLLSSDVSGSSNEEAYHMLRTKLTQLDTEAERPRAWRRHLNDMLRTAAAVAATLVLSWYFFGSGKDDTGYHHIEVASGQRVKLELADSSIVWLAAGTRFSYPENFSKDRRHVMLDGEAHFHVSQHKETPFEVETETYTVDVLGTKFSVYAYDEASHFETTLYEGSVALRGHAIQQEDILLEPGQKASYEKQGKQLAIYNQVEASEMDDKVAGYIIFNKTTFGDMAERLSRYYRIPIRIEDPAIAEYECTGKFHYYEKLEKILEVVKAGRPFEYRITDDEVVIYSKK